MTTDYTPTPEIVLERPEEIPGYTYGTAEAAASPLTFGDLDHRKAVVGLTAEDEAVLHVTLWTRAYVDDANW